MTPENRAANLLHAAAEANLLDGYERSESAKWHGLIATAIRDALIEARDLCRYVPDRIRIGELFTDAETQDDRPGLVECPVCEGSKQIAGTPCRACNGMGLMSSSGSLPDPAPGWMGVKPCGCAADWFGAGAPSAYQVERRRYWAEAGWTERIADAREAMPLITLGTGCHHDPRVTPRAAIGAPDVVSP